VDGKAWDITRPGIVWNGEKWVGDVPDIKPDSPPGQFGAFIMTAEGVGRLFAPSLADGPMPEHYEAIEAATDNILHPKVTSNPASKKFKSDKDIYGKKEDFPIICTTYRLTELYHYWTEHTAALNQLQPGFFIEIPEELAKEKGIANGGRAKITSARGSIEGVAMVTKRLRPLLIDGKPLWHVGFPIHWGYQDDPKHAGPLANFLTPTAMDPNTWTPEFKTFLVKLEKGSGDGTPRT
jgi:anaerobic selenocysteine-containing dehydrogenase